MIRKSNIPRWLYASLGVIIATSVRLSIALAVVQLKNDDGDRPTIAKATGRSFAATGRPSVVTGRPSVPTGRPSAAETERPNPG